MENLASTVAETPVTSIAVADSSLSVASVGNMLGGLLVVIAIIFALAYLAKRFKLAATNQGLIKVVAVTAIGAKEKLVLISYEDKQYLLGVTAQQINVIDKTIPISELEHEFSDSLADSLAKVKDSE